MTYILKELIRAVICAGLYPHVCKTMNGRKPKFFTKDNRKVKIHPSSVNSMVSDFRHRWLVFQEILKSQGGTFIMESSMVTPAALLLFGGTLKQNEEEEVLKIFWSYNSKNNNVI